MEHDGIERSVDPAQLSWPPESDLASEDYFVRGYEDMRGLSWNDALQTLEAERDILVGLTSDTSGTEECSGLYGFDSGVAAAVVALSAANCAPVSSCNGGTRHHEPYPLIAFYCRKGRVQDLLKTAEFASCGLVNGNSGSLVLYARHVDDLLLFAEELIKIKDNLKPLSRPRSHRNKPSPKTNTGQLPLPMNC